MGKSNNNTQKQKSKTFWLFAIAGAAIGVVILVFWVLPFPRSLISQKRCAANLRELGRAMLVYAGDYDEKYPMADKWCDILSEYIDMGKGNAADERDFKCPANKNKRCSYAINQNVSKRSHQSLVLLFESEGGWNQFGGPELLTFENHDGKGSNVLFNDLHVEFVTPDQFGKLKWKDEDVDLKQARRKE